MSAIPVVLVNNTSDQLVMSGYSGSDLTNLAAVGTPINAGSALLLGYMTLPGTYGDNYDWIYLTDNSNSGTQYQLYMEYNSFGPGLNPNLFALMGYKNTNSNEGNGNTSPFPNANSYTPWFASGTGPNKGTASSTSAITYIFSAPPPGLASLWFSPTSVTGGQKTTGTVTISGAAGSVGASIELKSSNPSALSVPASVTIAADSLSATFEAMAGTVSTAVQVQVTATFFGGTEVATVTVNPAQG